MNENVKATFDTTTTEGKLRVFNAQNGASVSLKKLETGTIIDCVGVLQYEETTDTYNNGQEVTVTVLFDAEGCSYAGVSATIADAAGKLIELFKATGLDTIRVALTKGTSNGGREYLSLRAVM